MKEEGGGGRGAASWQLAPESSRRAGGPSPRSPAALPVSDGYEARTHDIDIRERVSLAGRRDLPPLPEPSFGRAREARQMPDALTALCNYDQLKGKRPTRTETALLYSYTLSNSCKTASTSER
eukprot:scaffold17274_cov68-Phaeocystis_antarctica.AAC.1